MIVWVRPCNFFGFFIDQIYFFLTEILTKIILRDSDVLTVIGGKKKQMKIIVKIKFLCNIEFRNRNSAYMMVELDYLNYFIVIFDNWLPRACTTLTSKLPERDRRN